MFQRYNQELCYALQEISVFQCGQTLLRRLLPALFLMWVFSYVVEHDVFYSYNFSLFLVINNDFFHIVSTIYVFCIYIFCNLLSFREGKMFTFTNKEGSRKNKCLKPF